MRAALTTLAVLAGIALVGALVAAVVYAWSLFTILALILAALGG